MASCPDDILERLRASSNDIRVAPELAIQLFIWAAEEIERLRQVAGTVSHGSSFADISKAARGVPLISVTSTPVLKAFDGA